MENTNSIELKHRLAACRQTPLQHPDNFPFIVENYYFDNLEITVVRDDLLCGGTKSRVLYPYLIDSGLAEDYFDYVYVSPWYGGAQIALAWTCALLQQNLQQHYQATLFYPAPEGLEGVEVEPDDSRIPPYTRVALSYGAQVFFVSPGTEYQAAQDYIKTHHAYLLPSGFNTPYVSNLITDLASNLIPYLGRFDECWSAVGSGTLIRSLEKSKIADKYYGVCVFQECHNIGLAQPIFPEITFEETYPSSLWPPFSSALHYDAKVWPFLIFNSTRERKILYWNVM